MITRKKRKWALIIALLLFWGVGLLAFLRLYGMVGVKAKEVPPINPVIGTTREVAIPVLLFHGIVEQEDGENITIANFRDQMTSLKENGYTTLDTSDIYAYYMQGAKLPEKPIVITFDDGRKDSYNNGDPILKEMGFKAVMFVVSEKADLQDPFFLSWDELRAMHDSGRWDLEAHAFDGHDTVPIDAAGNEGDYYSNKMWLASQNRLENDEEYQYRVISDLTRVKTELEVNVPGDEPIAFAFPLGDYGQMSRNIEKKKAVDTFLGIVKNIYPLSFELNYTGSDFNNFIDSDRSLLRRFEVHCTADDLIAKLQESRSTPLPYDVSSFSDDQLKTWFCNWGTTYVEDSTIMLSGNEKESGGEVCLYGGHYWDDYSLTTDVTVKAGSAYVIGRYVDDNNFAFCQISNTDIVIGQKIRGEYKNLEELPVQARDKYRIELDFSGNTMTLKLDGAVVGASVTIDPSLAMGGVGFQTWNPKGGAALISISRVAVVGASRGAPSE